jgi:hypothetical protein
MVGTWWAVVLKWEWSSRELVARRGSPLRRLDINMDEEIPDQEESLVKVRAATVLCCGDRGFNNDYRYQIATMTCTPC